MTTKLGKDLKISTKAFIVEAIRDIVNDPDFGLELSREATRRLEHAQNKKEKTTSLSEIKKRYY